jgi:hypothetical protein
MSDECAARRARPAPVQREQRGPLVAALVAVAVVVSCSTTQVRSHVSHVSDFGTLVVPQLQRTSEIELNVTRASLQLRHAIRARTAEEKAAALAKVTDRKRLVAERRAEFGKATSPAADQAACVSMQVLVTQFWAVGGENVALIERCEKEAALSTDRLGATLRRNADSARQASRTFLTWCLMSGWLCGALPGSFLACGYPPVCRRVDS